MHACSSKLASGIVSTALQCGTGRCPTDDLQLDTPVRITIEHSDTVKVVHYVLCCWCCYSCGLGMVDERQHFRNTVCVS